MDEVIKQVLMVIASYLGVILILFLGLNFLMAGALTTWIRVKMSRGKKVLVKARSTIQDYYKAGVIDKGFLIYTDNAKEQKRISINQDSVYRSLGVYVIDVDDEHNYVLNRTGKNVAGFDAVKFNNLYLRALYKPTIYDTKEKIILALLVVAIIGIAVLGFLLFNQGEKLQVIMDAVAPNVIK